MAEMFEETGRAILGINRQNVPEPRSWPQILAFPLNFSVIAKATRSDTHQMPLRPGLFRDDIKFGTRHRPNPAAFSTGLAAEKLKESQIDR